MSRGSYHDGTTPAAREQMMISAAAALRSALQEEATRLKYGTIPDGQLDAVLGRAQGLLRGFSNAQLASVSVNTGLVTSLAGLSLGALYGGLSPEQVRALHANAGNANNAAAGDVPNGETANIRLLRRAGFDDASAGSEGIARGRNGYSALPSGNSVRWEPSSGIGGITAGNFSSTPFAAAGMNFGTFQYLAATVPGASQQNILHAAQDSTRFAGGPNDRPALRDFGILDRDDGARRGERNRLFDQLRRTAQNDAQLRALAQQYHAATDPQIRAQILAQIDARGQELRERTGVGNHQRGAPTPLTNTAIGNRAGNIVRRSVGINQEYVQRNGAGLEAQITTDTAARRQTETGTAPQLQQVNREERSLSNRRTAENISSAADDVLGAAPPARPETVRTPTAEPTQTAIVTPPAAASPPRPQEPPAAAAPAGTPARPAPPRPASPTPAAPTPR